MPIFFSLTLLSCTQETPPASDEGRQGGFPSSHSGKGGQAAPELFSGKLSTWKTSGDFLGAGWEGPSGIIIDDVSDLSGLKPPEKTVAEGLVKELAPRRIVSCADFTYSRRDRPANITLRVFVFADLEAARNWWKTRYDSQKTLYDEVEPSQVGSGVERAIDSKQMKKRIALSRNVLFTCGQVHDNEDHLKVLQRYLQRLESS